MSYIYGTLTSGENFGSSFLRACSSDNTHIETCGKNNTLLDSDLWCRDRHKIGGDG